jgi:hypothetical protein
MFWLGLIAAIYILNIILPHPKYEKDELGNTVFDKFGDPIPWGSEIEVTIKKKNQELT